MARATAREAAIESGAETPVYQDQRQVVRKLGAHLEECFMGQVTGAGGAGGDLAGIPFEPALVEIINEAGATPAWAKYAMLATPIGVRIAAAAVDATADAPAVAVVAGPPQTWTLTLDTADAPDAETVTVIVYGFRDVAGSL